ncbi:Nucleotidylyl transferase [Xylariomycetidae sp. FL0641]|nr:Nucleotidylyl transferase [Xylariomycetidae sp. FL0641]
MPAAAEATKMAARLPPNLVELFAQALKTFQHSSARFRVLCSLPASSSDIAAQPPSTPPRRLYILDSSFNPPTRAHRRMAQSALRSSTSSDPAPRLLLLLAIQNADKAPQPAAFPERLAMMWLLAQDLLSSSSSSSDGSTPTPTVDIAVTTDPYFAGKSAAVAESGFYTPSPPPPSSSSTTTTTTTQQPPEQVYLAGYDTLVRIFDAKYYGSSSPDAMRGALAPFFARAALRVTARPAGAWGGRDAQRRYLDGLRAGEWAGFAARVELAEAEDEGEEGADTTAEVSSTKVREAVRAGDWDALGRLVVPGVRDWVRERGLYCAAPSESG